MGLFDNIRGKKNGESELILERSGGGYRLKGTRAKAPRIGMVCVFFSVPAPEAEAEALKSLIGEFGLADTLAADAVILTDSEPIPGIDEYLKTREMPEALNAFLMSRAMLKGLARNQAEMGKLGVDPFEVMGTKGVLVQKDA
jgi:hypothetical protein